MDTVELAQKLDKLGTTALSDAFDRLAIAVSG